MAIDPISIGLGAASLIGGKNAQKKQNRMMDRGLKLEEALAQMKLRSSDRMFGMAEGYDPEKDTQVAIERAQQVAEESLGRGMGKLVKEYAAGGAAPGLSSEWNVKVGGMKDRVMDPLKDFVANMKAGNFNRKMNAYAMASGSMPGQLGDAYFKYASMMPGGGDMGGGLGALFQGLSGLFKNGAGGAGGRGDAPGKYATAPSSGWRFDLDPY